MSNDDQTFEERIEEIYQQYRHSELESRLEDAAETMEETILQRILAEEFLQTDIEIDDDAKQAVRDARALLDDRKYEELADMIDDLEAKVEDQKRQVSNQIHEVRINMRSTVSGIQRLNQRVERVNEVKLEAINELLEDWDWRTNVYRGEDETLAQRKQNAEEYGRLMRTYFEKAREEIFGPYIDTPLESIVNGLLSEERLALDELSDEQLDQLRGSDLESYVELSLS